jgi:hypothetical protein
MDIFLLNKKNIDSKTILHKNLCNMHIALCNIHIMKVSILWPTHTHPQHPPKLYLLARGLSPIHLTCWHRVQGLIWGARGPFLPVVTMVGYGCVGRCWPLEANVRSTYCRNSKNCLLKYFFNSYVDTIHS